MQASFRTRANLLLLIVAWPFLVAGAVIGVGWGLAATADRFLKLHWGLQADYFPAGLKTTAVLIAAAVLVRILREVVEERARDERGFYATPLQRWFR
jgi:hypothetical protein